MRWLKFGLSSLCILVIGIGLFSLVSILAKVHVIENIIQFVDTVVFAFFEYVSIYLIVLWFVIPVAVIWISYLLKSFFVVVTNRVKFKQWEKQNQEESTNNQLVEDVSEGKGYNNVAKRITFLEGTPLTSIRYNSLLGLQRAYEVAKKKGLQIGETKTGYIAVYANPSGMKKLQSLLSNNDIEDFKLQNRPSLVFIDKGSIESLTIKSAMEKLKAGDKIE